MKTDSEKVYQELLSLLLFIKDKGRFADFYTYYGYQRSYLSAIMNKNTREINWKTYLRKGSYYSNKDIIKCLKRFITKEKL